MAEVSIAPDVITTHEPVEVPPTSDHTNTFDMTKVGEISPNEITKMSPPTDQPNTFEMSVVGEVSLNEGYEVTYKDISMAIEKIDAEVQCEILDEVLVEADKENSSEMVSELKLKIQSLEDSLKDQQNEKTLIMQSHQKAVTEDEILRMKTVQEYEEKLGQSRIENSKLEEKVQLLEEQYKSVVETYKTSVTEYEVEKTRVAQEYETKLGEIKIDKTKLEERVKVLEKEKEDAIEKNELSLNESKEQLQTQKIELEETLEMLEDEKKDSVEKDREQSKALQEYEAEMEDLRNTNTMLEQTLQELKNEKQQISEKLKEDPADIEVKKSLQLQNTIEELKKTVGSLEKENRITKNAYEKKLADMETSKEVVIQNYEQQIREIQQEKDKLRKNHKEAKPDGACLKFKTVSSESSYERRIEEVRIEMREKCELEIKGAEEAARVALIRKYEDMLTQVSDIKQEILITFTESVKNYELKISEIHIFYEQKLEALRQQQEDEQNAAAAKEIEALQKKCDDMEVHYKDIMDEMKNEMKENWENERKEMEEKFEKEKEVLIEENEKGGDEYETKINELSESYEHTIAHMVLEYSALEERYYSSIKDLEEILEKMKMPIERSTITCVVETRESSKYFRKETTETKTNTSVNGNHLHKGEKESIPGKENQQRQQTDDTKKSEELIDVKDIKGKTVNDVENIAENGEKVTVDEKENANEVNEHTAVQVKEKQQSHQTDDMKQNEELIDAVRDTKSKAVNDVENIAKNGERVMVDEKVNVTEVKEHTAVQVEEKQNSHQTDDMKQNEEFTDVVRDIKSKTVNDVKNIDDSRRVMVDEKENINEANESIPELSREPTPLCAIVDTLDINREEINISPEQTKSLISIKYSRKCFHELQEETIRIQKDQDNKTPRQARKVIPDFQKALNMLKEKQEIEELLTSLQNEIADEQLNFLHAMQFKKDGEFDDYSQSPAKQMIEEKLPLEAELRVTIQEILELLEDDGLRQNSRLIQKKAERKDEIESRLETIYESIHSEPMRAAEALTCLLKTKNRYQDQLQNLETTLKGMKEEIESEMKLDASFVDILPEKLIIDLCLSTYQEI